MSPPSLRRYRAERLVRDEFQTLRERVLRSVEGRLRRSGASLDRGDLEECYAQAWHGLYMTLLEGREVANPTGWLVVATFRRAIEEQRSRRRHACNEPSPAPRRELEELAAPGARDLAEDLQARVTVRNLLEGIGQLNPREREAAALCYLQGLSRAEAARQLGLSEAGMRKLMDGPGSGRPGVAAKVGRLAERIRAEAWCEEQGSLMRGLAFGVLDPAGQRYRLAQVHRRECPACRAYVASLRGLAAALPPPLPPVLASAVGLSLAGSPPANVAQAHGGATGAAAAPFASGVGAASGAGGVAGAAGGGWITAAGAKLAVGCLVAIGVGVGCLPLYRGAHRPPGAAAAGGNGAPPPAARSHLAAAGTPGSRGAAGGATARPGPPPTRAMVPAGTRPATPAAREFGPERVVGDAPSTPTGASTAPAVVSKSRLGAPISPSTPPPPSGSFEQQPPARVSAAEREFAPG